MAINFWLFVVISHIIGFTLVTALTIPEEVALLPKCSISCLAEAVDSAGCGHTDYACQCGPANFQIKVSASACLPNSCTAAEIASKARIREADVRYTNLCKALLA
jgi:hypothetical protein